VLGGIVGTLLSVPIAAVAWAVIKSWNDPVTLEDLPEAGSRSRSKK
jgi:predicted PurR-regulated permease PerM